jgi:hypothetical protein
LGGLVPHGRLTLFVLKLLLLIASFSLATSGLNASPERALIAAAGQFQSGRSGGTTGSNTYWISTNATRNFVNPKFHVGMSLDAPLDGSTAATFDDNMNHIPPHSRIYLLPGTYQTLGDAAWGPKTGQQIIGSGMDITVLQFPSNAIVSGRLVRPHLIKPLSPYRQTNILVSDLTLDGNYQPGTIITINGIGLHGSGNTIQRVKLINTAAFSSAPTNYAEAWGLLIESFPFSEASGNTIADCVVSNFTCNHHNNLSALGLLENNSGKILNNLIVQKTSNSVFGFYPGSHQSIAEGNTLLGVAVGSHYDDGTGVTNVLIVNNRFINCSAAIDWANGVCQNVTIAFNEIVLGRFNARQFSTEAINFYPPPAAYRNITVFGNTVSLALDYKQIAPAHFIVARNADGLLIQNNTVDPHLTNYFSHCTNVVLGNNHDPAGNDLATWHASYYSGGAIPQNRKAAPSFAEIGRLPGKVFIWSSNSTPTTIYASYYDAKTNLQTRWSK